jgi:purine-binding chemotaxis protein CheW
VVFTLGQEEYAFPIEQVREIIRYTRPRSVASTSPSVLGVINLRGRIVTIYDLASRVGAESSAGERAKIVIVEAAGHSGGVIVDEVKAVQTVDDQHLEPVPTATAAIIDAIANVGERLVILLKPDALFDAAS